MAALNAGSFGDQYCQVSAVESQYAYNNALQSIYPEVQGEQLYGQQQSRKRGYDTFANNFFEDAKRSRVEPVYNPAMAQRLSGLNNYINDGWNYVDQNYNSSLPALKTKQDLLEIDQWLYQLFNTVQQGSYPSGMQRGPVYGAQPGSIYPSVPAMLQNDYSQSLKTPGSASLYPDMSPGGFGYSNQVPMYHNSAVLPQVGRYNEPRRTIDISQLQAAPSVGKISSVRDTPVTAPSEDATPSPKAEELSTHVEKMTIADEKAVVADRVRHIAMIKTMRDAIASMLKKMEAAERSEDTKAPIVESRREAPAIAV